MLSAMINETQTLHMFLFLLLQIIGSSVITVKINILLLVTRLSHPLCMLEVNYKSSISY